MTKDNIIELEPGAQCRVAIAFHMKACPLFNPSNNMLGFHLCSDWLELICEAAGIKSGPIMSGGRRAFNRGVHVIETTALNETLAAVKARLAKIKLLECVSIGWCYTSENIYRSWHPTEGSDTDFNALLSAEAIRAGLKHSADTRSALNEFCAARARGASMEEMTPLATKLHHLLNEEED